MMAFCKKSVHSVLSLSNPLLLIDTNSYTNSNTNICNIISYNEKLPPPPPGGLGLITGEPQNVSNVLESATVKKEKDHAPLHEPQAHVSMLPLWLSPHSPGKKDTGGIGFIDDRVDGMMSCTESLGFESCDGRGAKDEMELNSGNTDASKAIKWRKVGWERRQVKNFPPPLSSLKPNGQPCFYLRPVRTDGRLELTEVRIDRPEILRPSREGGRLILHLVCDDEEEGEEKGEEISLDLQGNEENKIMDEEVEEEEGSDQMKVVEEDKWEEERRVSSDTNTATNNNTHGEISIRRCQEGAAVGHVHRLRGHHRHGNHHLHTWSQQCVTTCR